jgi:hypothetical protein
MMSSISGYTFTGDLPGKNTFFVKRKQLGSTLTKCNGYEEASRNSLQATNFSYNITKVKPIWTYSQQPHSSPYGTTRPQATETTSAH